MYYRAMLTEERKTLILDRLKKNGRIIAKDVSTELGLSEDTIRRDLRELAAQGLLLRVHGGGLPASPTVATLSIRRNMSVTEKVRLGTTACQLFQRQQTVFIDGGTSNLEMVKNIPLGHQGTIITHSPLIAAAFEHHLQTEVILLGGKLYRHSMVATGAATLEAIANIRVDIFFLGLTGFHPDEGLTTGDYEEAIIKRAIMARSGETVSLVTSEKIDAASPYRIAHLSALSTLVVVREAKLPKFSTSCPRILRAI
jgi:DeoR/GlpR family transcriptional regulator of sugar metabolism